jgi:flagellar biosynthesis chaperone FliJ
MSLESAKMRLEQAVARRDHIQREVEDTDRQLQAVNQKQAEIAQKLFMQGGIDIYRQTQQIEDCLKIQNEKIDRASQNIKASAEAVKRSNEKLNKIDLDSLEYITNTLKELDSRTDQTYTALLDSKKRAYEEALNEFISEHDKKKKDLDKLIQDKQDQVKSLDKKIEELEHIKSSKEAKKKISERLWIVFLSAFILTTAVTISILVGWGIALVINRIVAFVVANWPWFVGIGLIPIVLFILIKLQ